MSVVPQQQITTVGATAADNTAVGATDSDTTIGFTDSDTTGDSIKATGVSTKL
ncbi:unnamed protein product [Arabis nemorensis]|uniref:Uncharacterized protein n=1 Tax=Arabis nemorensis TaxID=586526 RepID=A0A565CTG4_9BRAS|nr:unnamed protein product [Arabis nemorensis]